MHSHLARQPVPVHEVEHTIPFDEQGAEVGSNQDAGAKPVLIIDELYEICRDEVLTQIPR